MEVFFNWVRDNVLFVILIGMGICALWVAFIVFINRKTSDVEKTKNFESKLAKDKILHNLDPDNNNSLEVNEDPEGVIIEQKLEWQKAYEDFKALDDDIDS